MNRLVAVLTAAGTILLVAGVWRVAQTGADLVRGDATYAQVSAPDASRMLRGLRVPVLWPEPGDTLDLGDAEVAVVLVFDPACGPCNRNMANWIDLIAELSRASVPVMAIAVGDSPELTTYWGELKHHLTVLGADSATAVAAGLRGTPGTMVLKRGRIVRDLLGPLNEAELSDVLTSATR